jgi:hypothetical protein
MRKLKLIEHIFLDGVIQASGRRRLPIQRLDRAVSHSCGVSHNPCGTRRELRSAAWPANLRYLVGFLA